MKKEPGRKEVEYKLKSGTAWSHSYLNQKPWHPLSYPNQRRKWIAEQTHSERERRGEEVAREFAQEQEFFRTSAMLSKKEREKVEAMQAVSFMYVRPPGYNAESARAAEITDEKKHVGDDTELNIDNLESKADEKRKERVKDLYGRTVPTEEEFPVLKNAPRLESGASARVKPFAIEIRNVKCARCGAFGHQSGDRECPMKDSITPSEEARQRRDDPLTIMTAVVSDEPLKWELKQRPGGLSPPRGGFKADDPNQQIIPEDIYDEYGGFLAGGTDVGELLASFKQKKHKDKERRKRRKKSAYESDGDSDHGLKHKVKKGKHNDSNSGGASDHGWQKKVKKGKYNDSNSDIDSDHGHKHRAKKAKHNDSDSDGDGGHGCKRKVKKCKNNDSDSDSDSDSDHGGKHRAKGKHNDSDSDGDTGHGCKIKLKKGKYNDSDSEGNHHHRHKTIKDKHKGSDYVKNLKDKQASVSGSDSESDHLQKSKKLRWKTESVKSGRKHSRSKRKKKDNYPDSSSESDP